eukprot:12888665-Prorocentrum_lima.AAC.1
MQFGFRTHRGTREALFSVRSAADIGESTKPPVSVILLDWEKAFDKIRHDRLLQSLERLAVPTPLLAAVRSIYTNPTFQ